MIQFLKSKTCVNCFPFAEKHSNVSEATSHFPALAKALTPYFFFLQRATHSAFRSRIPHFASRIPHSHTYRPAVESFSSSETIAFHSREICMIFRNWWKGSHNDTTSALEHSVLSCVHHYLISTKICFSKFLRRKPSFSDFFLLFYNSKLVNSNPQQECKLRCAGFTWE